MQRFWTNVTCICVTFQRLKALVTGCHPKYEALNGITENLDNSIFLSSIFGGCSAELGYSHMDGGSDPPCDPQERWQMEVLKRSPGTDLETNALAPLYWTDEEKWLEDRMVEYDVIMKGVSFGDEAIGEFARFSLDEPLSRSFLPNSIHIFRVSCSIQTVLRDPSIWYIMPNTQYSMYVQQMQNTNAVHSPVNMN